MILKKTFNVSYSNVGCIILIEPLFFEEKDWISPPDNWPSNTVVGKVYDMEKDEGRRLFKEVCDRLQRKSVSSQVVINDIKEPYKYSFVKHRLGQGAFRVLVTDAYFRQCAISREKVLPALEAAYIEPYAENGPHLTQNGVLLRADIHKLFDNGYLTIAPDFRVEVSKRVKEDFGNGRVYYQYHCQRLSILPNNIV